MASSERTGSAAGPSPIALAWRARLGRLGLGTAQLGNLYTSMSDDVAGQVLEAAWDAGIRYFDTAPHYGLGLSEERLGRYLAGRRREEYVVSSKAGRRLVPSPETASHRDDDLFDVPAARRREWDFTEAGLRAGVEESLTRLGLDHLDIVYLHDPDVYDLDAALRGAIPALARLRDEGLAHAIGVGSNDASAIVECVRTGALDVVMVAGRYTLLERSDPAGLLAACAEHGTGVVCAAVFNSGLLAASEVPADAMYDYRPAPAGVLDQARRLAATCAGMGVELPAAALQFPLRHPAVSTVVAGAATAEQVRQNVDRLTQAVPQRLWNELVRLER